MIAQLSVYPIGEGTSLGRFVRKGVKVIEESGYTYLMIEGIKRPRLKRKKHRRKMSDWQFPKKITEIVLPDF